MRLLTALAAVVVPLVFTGCGSRSGEVPVPRPQGYPRIEVYEPEYAAVHLPGGLAMEFNRGCTVVADTVSAGWFNIEYPSYRATVYCTLSDVTPVSVGNVLDNRIERMALNSGGAPGELSEAINRDGVSWRLLVTPAGSLIPVQFLATDSMRFVVSGAMVLDEPALAAPDSVAPVIDAVSRDMIHTLETIRWNPGSR